MDSQMERPHGHRYEQEQHHAGLHAAAEGENEHHQEKSVLKKVKAKARKIKDTLKLHGHGHDHDQNLPREGQVPDDHDLDEEDGEEFDDPEVHNVGAGSASESAPTRSSMPGQEDVSQDFQAKETDPMESFIPAHDEDRGQLKVAAGNTSNIKEVPYTPLSTPASIAPGIMEQTKGTDPIGTFAREQEAIRGQPEVNLDRPIGLEEDPHAPKSRPGEHDPSNYQTKVSDPTSAGGEEAEVGPILRSFDNMKLSGEPNPVTQENLSTRKYDQSIFPTGSHDQFSPEPTPPIPMTSQENPTSAPLTDARKDDAKEHEMHGGQDQTKAAPALEYGRRIATSVTEKLTPVYEKVAETGSTVMSKVHGTRTGTDKEVEHKATDQDKGVSVKDYVTEKLKPGEEDRALSEVISEALHKKKPDAEKADKPMGRVTESEEVKRRLGGMEEDSGDRVKTGSVHVSGSGMVEKVKGVVGSLFGKGTETPEHSLDSSAGTETDSASGEKKERRLQESGN